MSGKNRNLSRMSKRLVKVNATIVYEIEGSDTDEDAVARAERRASFTFSGEPGWNITEIKVIGENFDNNGKA